MRVPALRATLTRADGVTTTIFESTPVYPTASRFWETVAKHKLTQFYTAPTAIRLLRRLGEKFVEGHDLSSLRTIGSVGEPINPEAWHWYNEHVGKKECAVVDTYWQTETGSIILTYVPPPGVPELTRRQSSARSDQDQARSGDAPLLRYRARPPRPHHRRARRGQRQGGCPRHQEAVALDREDRLQRPLALPRDVHEGKCPRPMGGADACSPTLDTTSRETALDVTLTATVRALPLLDPADVRRLDPWPCRRRDQRFGSPSLDR